MSKIKKNVSSNYQDYFDQDLSSRDPDLYKSIKLELERQQQHIELIASENIVSKGVLDAQGSILTNKYAEGYPGKRYYGGCEFVDKSEELALERVKQLFNCKYANVQPHSGAQANGAVYLADNWSMIGKTQGNSIKKAPLLLWQKEDSKRGKLARENPKEAIKKYAVGREHYVVAKSPIKKVFVKPLVKNWKKVLNKEVI